MTPALDVQPEGGAGLARGGRSSRGPWRVVLSDNLNGWNGQSYAVLQLGVELAARGHTLRIVTPKGSELSRRARARGLAIVDDVPLRGGLRPLEWTGGIAAARRLLEEFDPDHVVTSGSTDTWRLAVARRLERHRARLVRWRHNTLRLRRSFANRWLHTRGIDHVAVGSSSIAPLYIESGLVSAESITLFPYCADLAAFANARRTGATQRELALAEDTPLVVAVGRLSWEKGHDVLVRAFAQVHRAHPRAHLVIVGEGAEREALSALAESLGLAGAVHLLGFREQIAPIYADAELAVLTPVAGESFGISLLEGLAAARACVATDVGGVGELVVDGVTGRLVAPRDERAIAAAIGELLGDPVTRERFGREGQARVLERYTPQRLGDACEDLFLRLVAD